MNETLTKFNRSQTNAAITGLLGLIACGVALAFDHHQFFISYLFAFIFWTSLSLGCFYAAMIHYLTGGRWGFPARRFLEAGFMTLPLMAIFLVPIFFGLHELYPWARPETVANDKILLQRSSYENVPGFAIRAIIFFGIWIFIAIRLRKWSLEQDTTESAGPTMKIRTLSGPAVGIVPLTASFAFVEWAMSIETHWDSTIFPVIILSGQILMAFAFVTIMLAWVRNAPLIRDQSEKAFHDLGNFLLAFVMFWTYVAFSQVIIIYSANLPRETDWYLRRISGGWLWIAGFIILFHFFAPFLLLLFRSVKKNIRALISIALLILIVHAIEMLWMIAPTFYPRASIHWTDFAAWLGIGGIWLAVFLGNLKRHPLLARNDPRMENPVAQTAHAK